MDYDKNCSLGPFNDTVDASDLRREWEEWLRAFELFLELKQIDSQHERLVLMLTRGGRGLQRIYYNLRPVFGEIHPEPVRVPLAPQETPEYDNAVKRLNHFFVGKCNERVELEVFRSLTQSSGESFNHFILKLRTQAARCDFGDREEKEILQQVAMGALDDRVKDKGLENMMDLDELTNYAINREILMKQKQKLHPFKVEAESAGVSAVKQVWERKPQFKARTFGKPWNEGSRARLECDRCGSWKHQKDSQSCIARNSRCNNCGRTGHFARKCKAIRKMQIKARSTWKRAGGEANALQDGDRDDVMQQRRNPVLEDSLKMNSRNDGIITCKIDQQPVDFLIDSGAAINTVTQQVWEELINSKANLFKKRFHCDRKFLAFATQEPLRVLTIFEAWISVNESKPKSYAEFFVIEGSRKSLLSKRTAEDLRVLKVGLEVQTIEVKNDACPKFPNVQVKLSIDSSVQPRKIAYLRIPAAMEEKVDQKLLEMLKSDVIEPVVGPPEWISPMVVVPKGKDDIRLCINMKYPNEAIQREHYPLPMIDTFLNKLRGSTVFSKLDITSAFYHIELHPESRGITTFMTSRGLMRFKWLMFGINCAPEIFQRVMSGMLAGIEGVVVYIDDVVVAGRTKEEHDARLQEVLAVLKENNAILNKDKCLIGVSELEILGFKVSAAGICPSDEKVAAIQNFRRPETKEEARSFLGLVNFVGQFIPHLSTRSEPLRQFIRGDVENFGESQQRAFDDLRNALSNTVRRLGFFNPKDKTELYVDVSSVGLGAVLTQRNSDQAPRIICFASKGLTKTERVYPQTQREALAVVWAVEKFYPYLFGTHFTIFTDHKTLEYIYEGKHQQGKRACSRAEGWALRLQPYDFHVKHIPGSTNISDALSRLSAQFDTASDTPFDEATEVGVGPTAISVQEIRSETKSDEVLKAVITAIHSQEWPSDLVHYQAFKSELGIIDEIVVRDERIVLPSSLRRRALIIAHRGHPGVVTMRRNLREKVWWPYMDRDVGDYIQECAGCAAVSSQGPPEPMLRKEMPDRAWQDIAVEFFSAKECATFLVTVDYYSRFLRVTEMKGTTAAKTIEALESIFQEQTYPETIRSDNGPPFSSEEFSDYCSSKNIRLIRTIPYWPQMNGLVERQNQGILRTLRIAKAINTDWRKAIRDYVYAYNTTPHSITGKSPMELMTGRPVKDLLPSLRTEPSWRRDEETKDKDAIKKMQGKLYADQRRHARPSEIDVGDEVMLKNYETGKLEPKFRLDKFTVMKKSGNDVTATNEEGVMYRRPVSHLRKWPSGEGTESSQEASKNHQSHNSKVPEPFLMTNDSTMEKQPKSNSFKIHSPPEPPAMKGNSSTKKRLQEQSEGSSTAKRPKRHKKLPRDPPGFDPVNLPGLPLENPPVFFPYSPRITSTKTTTTKTAKRRKIQSFGKLDSSPPEITEASNSTSGGESKRRVHYHYYRKMNSMPNHADFMELGTIHQHQSTCKQHCFVFTEIADIDLPPEITKYPEKIKNGSIHSYKKDSMSPPPPKVPKSRRSRKIIAVVSALLVCIALAAGIPLGLQLRSSSLLEARLAFIRRLLAESPLVEGYWAPQMGANFSKSYAEVKNSMVGALLWPISVPCAAQYLDAVQLTLEGIDDARRMVKKNKEMIIVESADAMEQAHTDGKMAILFGLEGGHTLGSSLAVLRSMYSLGARFVSLTGLGCTTPWASASIRTDFFDENLPSTLTNFGEVVIQEMNRLGMLVEISRLSEPAMMVALNVAKAPLLLSNALPSSMACNGSTAAIPDHIMSALSQNGGVIMLNVERCGDKPMNLKDAIAAINYVRAIAGVGHVGLSGSPKNYPLLLAELARDRLWGSAAIKKLVGGNIVRVLREVEINKNRLPLSEDWIPLEAVEGNAYCRYPET